MSGEIFAIVLYLIGLLIFYGIIRKAVAHGMWDAWARRDARARRVQQNESENL